MTNDFMVSTAEILLVDEPAFLAAGGRSIRFGSIDGGVVCLHARGSADAIAELAIAISTHHTAAQ